MDDSRKKQLRSTYEKFKQMSAKERENLRKQFDAQRTRKTESVPDDTAGENSANSSNDGGSSTDGSSTHQPNDSKNDGGNGNDSGNQDGGGQGGGNKR